MSDDTISGYARGLLMGTSEEPEIPRHSPVPTEELLKFQRALLDRFGVELVIAQVNREQDYADIRLNNRPARVSLEMTSDELLVHFGFTEELLAELQAKRDAKVANRPRSVEELQLQVAVLQAELARLKEPLVPVAEAAKPEPVAKRKSVKEVKETGSSEE